MKRNIKVRSQIAGIIGAFFCIFVLSGCSETLQTVKVIKLKKQSLEGFAYAKATVEPKEVERIFLQEGVRVTQLAVKEGDIVEVGQALVSADNNRATRASIAGVVTDLVIAPGMVVNSNVPVMRIVDVRNMIIRAYISQKDAGRVTNEMEVLLYGDGIPRDKKLIGVITEISSIAKPIGEQTYIDAVVTLKGQEPPFLKVGMYLQCEIKVNKKDDILITTLDTIKEVGSDKYVFVYTDGVLTEKAIETGAEFGIKLELTPGSGLKEGDYLVVDPLPTYTTGMKVSAVEVMY